MSGDALATDEFWTITGAAGEGTLMTFAPEPRKLPTAPRRWSPSSRRRATSRRAIRSSPMPPCRSMPSAVAKAKSDKLDDVSKAMHANKFDTVIGTVGFDKKGDVVGPDYVVYRWHNGKREELK